MQSATQEEPITSLVDELERLFREYHSLVFRTGYRITGSAADAEDVLQTVFLRLAGRDPAAHPIEKCESYLRRAAVNAALDVLRARQAENRVPLDDSQPDPGPPNLALIERRELQDGLRGALATLNPEAAEVFALRFLDGYSNREIARLLRIPQVRVAVTVFRTRRRLQKEMLSYLGGRP